MTRVSVNYLAYTVSGFVLLQAMAKIKSLTPIRWRWFGKTRPGHYRLGNLIERTMRRVTTIIASVFLLIGAACTPAAEEVDLAAVLPVGAMQELTFANPDLSARLVSDVAAGPQVGYQYLEVSGVDDPERQVRFANFIAGYLNDPELKARQIAERAAHDALPPGQKLDALLVRLRERLPDLDYEWVKADEGNTGVLYGDNGLLLTGVEGEGQLAEIGNAILRLQREIDGVTPQTN
jgi:hypothetical protein